MRPPQGASIAVISGESIEGGGRCALVARIGLGAAVGGLDRQESQCRARRRPVRAPGPRNCGEWVWLLVRMSYFGRLIYSADPSRLFVVSINFVAGLRREIKSFGYLTDIESRYSNC